MLITFKGSLYSTKKTQETYNLSTNGASVMNGETNKFSWKDKHILITEDDEPNYIYLREILRPTNVKCSRAVNGSEAVKFCNNTEGVDLILMDILMPVMNGFEASKLIKETYPDIIIIAQTCHSLGNEDTDVLKYLDEYMTKPIWVHELLPLLSKYLVEA